MMKSSLTSVPSFRAIWMSNGGKSPLPLSAISFLAWAYASRISLIRCALPCPNAVVPTINKASNRNMSILFITVDVLKPCVDLLAFWHLVEIGLTLLLGDVLVV